MKKLLLTTLAIFINYLSYSQPFISEIKAFEKQDSLSMPAKGQIVLAGSSTFRFWITSKVDLVDYPTINRGFGGSQMSDLNFYFDRIVSKYDPKMILVYEGDNDLAAGESPASIFEDFKIFAEKVKTQLPNVIVGYCSIRPSIARVNIREKQVETNELIKNYCKSLKGFYFIDIYKEYFLPNGELMPDVFVSDKLHLNKKGYEIWAKATRKFLKKRFKS
jgi:lysophospholipase L1-like esterase